MRLKLQEYNAQSCSIVVKGLRRYSWSRFITCIHAERACEPVAKWPMMGHLRCNNNSNNYMSVHLGSQANQMSIYFFCTKMVFGKRSLGGRVWCRYSAAVHNRERYAGVVILYLSYYYIWSSSSCGNR